MNMLDFVAVPRLHEFETPESFVSRLAAENCIDTVKQLYSLTGSKAYDAQSRLKTSLEQVIVMAGLSLDEAMRYRVNVSSRNWYEVGGHLLRAVDFARMRPRYCPKCIASDLEGGSGTLEARSFQRFWWTYKLIERCPDHGCQMKLAAHERNSHSPDDFAAFVKNNVGTVIEESRQATCRPIDPFEVYLHGRLVGRPTTHWLFNEMSVQAVATTCEAVGRLFDPGRRRDGRRKLSRSRPGQNSGAYCRSGFSIMGQERDEFLRALHQRVIDIGAAYAGKISKYGRLIALLESHLEEADWFPIIDVLRTDILDTLPLAPGEQVLGVTVVRRLVHNVHTAIEQYGLCGRTIKNAVKALGLLEKAHASGGENLVVFRVEDAHATLSQIADSLSGAEAGKLLGVSRKVLETLVERELILVLQAQGVFGKRLPRYTKSSVRLLIDGILKLKVIDRAPENYEPLLASRDWAKADIGDILNMVLSGAVKAVNVEGQFGLNAVCVHAEDARKAMADRAPRDMPYNEVLRSLVLNRETLNRLVEVGLLTAEVRRSPLASRSTKYFAWAQLKAFSKLYVTLGELVRTSGLYPKSLVTMFLKAGLTPIHTTQSKREQTIYFRDKVETILTTQRLPLDRATFQQNGLTGPRRSKALTSKTISSMARKKSRSPR